MLRIAARCTTPSTPSPRGPADSAPTVRSKSVRSACRKGDDLSAGATRSTFKTSYPWARRSLTHTLPAFPDPPVTTTLGMTFLSPQSGSIFSFAGTRLRRRACKLNKAQPSNPHPHVVEVLDEEVRRVHGITSSWAGLQWHHHKNHRQRLGSRTLRSQHEHPQARSE